MPKKITFRVPDYELIQIPKKKNRKVLNGIGTDYINWGLHLANIPEVWRETEGENINVAILDSGVADHPDLEGAIQKPIENFTDEPVEDESGHGTFIAGIIGARKNGSDVVGIAPRCNLHIGKVLRQNNTSELEFVMNGLKWALEKKVDVISLSLGTTEYHSELYKLVHLIAEEGIFIISAIGNGREIEFPAKFAETIGVGSIDRHLIARSGLVGYEIDVVAPGVAIQSTHYLGGVGYVPTGTSFSVPFIAGITALILAKHRSGFYRTPVNTVDQLRMHLFKMAFDLGLPGRDMVYGRGVPVDWSWENELSFIKSLTPLDLNESGFKKLVNHLLKIY